MFFKFSHSQARSRIDVRELPAADAIEMRSRINELEAEVARLKASSKELSQQLTQAQAEAKRPSAFGEAWSKRDEPGETSKFFEQGEVDERARRWLLKP